MFILIRDVECDWGSHTLIQCPKCSVLFSDIACRAFENLLNLAKVNPDIFDSKELAEYFSDHSC